MKIEYLKQGNYLIPNLKLKENDSLNFGKYGYLRLEYLKKYKKALYQTLLMKGELTNHLISINNECSIRLKILMDNYIKNDEKLSEKSKENNQIEWVKLMNNYKICAEEIILKELIYI